MAYFRLYTSWSWPAYLQSHGFHNLFWAGLVTKPGAAGLMQQLNSCSSRDKDLSSCMGSAHLQSRDFHRLFWESWSQNLQLWVLTRSHVKNWQRSGSTLLGQGQHTIDHVAQALPFVGGVSSSLIIWLPQTFLGMVDAKPSGQVFGSSCVEKCALEIRLYIYRGGGPAHL